MNGRVAERRGRALQKLLHRFKSGPDLHKIPVFAKQKGDFLFCSMRTCSQMSLKSISNSDASSPPTEFRCIRKSRAKLNIITSKNKTLYFANNKFLLLVLFNFIFIYSFSQYNFQKTYKGLNLWFGLVTADGGYIATGSTRAYGAGSDDFFLLKLNPLGITEWLKTYGSSSKDIAYYLLYPFYCWEIRVYDRYHQFH